MHEEGKPCGCSGNFRALGFHEPRSVGPMKQFIKLLLAEFGLLGKARSFKSYVNTLTPTGRRRAKRDKIQIAMLKEFYRQFIKKNDLCFDIGANMGVRTEIFRDLGATVVCVEPGQQCIDALNKKFKKDPRITVVAKGVGQAEGTRSFYVSSDTLTSSFSREWIDSVRSRLEGFTWLDPVQVPVTTLNRLIEEYGCPSFCKIDVEGYELEVLNGLDACIPLISFEYTPERLKPSLDCIRKLITLGSYEFNYSIEQATSYALNHWLPGEKFCIELLKVEGSRQSGDVYARI